MWQIDISTWPQVIGLIAIVLLFGCALWAAK